MAQARAATFAFPKPPLVQPVVDDNGAMDRNWQAWFQQVFAQIKVAAYLPSNVAITGGTITGISTLTATGVITSSNLTGTNTGDQSFTASGDVTAPASKTNLVMTIGTGAVTYAKIQKAVGAALLGATAAGGTYAEITLGNNLAFSGSAVGTPANGVVFPSFTATAKAALPSPTAGQTVYDTTNATLSFWNGTAWKLVTAT